MAIETKYYLDQAGLEALVAKIKELHQANADEITRIIEEIIGTDETVAGSLREQIQDILTTLSSQTDDLATIADTAGTALEKANASFSSVSANNDIDNQTLTLVFSDNDGNNVECPIDTSEFIVNGILQDAQVVTGDKFAIVQVPVIDEETGEPAVDEETGEPVTEPKLQCTLKDDSTITVQDEAVQTAVYPDFPAATNYNDKAQFLLLTFGVKPATDDETPSVHEPEAQYAWVNLGNLISSYTFVGDENISVVKDSNNVVTITLTQELSDTLDDVKETLGEGGLENVDPDDPDDEYADWEQKPVDDGLRARVEWLETYAANKPISTDTIDSMFADSDDDEPVTPTPDPDEPVNP